MATPASKPSKTAAKAPPPKPDTDLGEIAPPKKKKKGGRLKIALLLTLLLVCAGGAAWYFLGDKLSAEADKPLAARSEKGTKGAKTKPVSSEPPVFLALDPFTVNLQYDEASPQYLQVGLSIKLADETSIETLKLYMPEIRSRILLLLSSKRADDITTPEGKNKLSAELITEIAQPLAGRVSAKALLGVLFTSFLVQ